MRDAQKLEAVGRLAGGVAHDFNNVLTVVSGHAELLREEVERQPGPGGHHGHPRRRRRASDLTRQLLAFSRLQELRADASSMHAERRPRDRVATRRVVGEHVQLERRLELGSAWLSADPAQLEQVLLNLAVNARDAMPDGGTLDASGTSGVDARDDARAITPRRRPGRYMLITVSDTGTGMDEATQERIFEPFFTTKAAGQGHGPRARDGLRHRQAERWPHLVDSRLGHGTTFEILLPEAQGVIRAALAGRGLEFPQHLTSQPGWGRGSRRTRRRAGRAASGSGGPPPASPSARSR